MELCFNENDKEYWRRMAKLHPGDQEIQRIANEEKKYFSGQQSVKMTETPIEGTVSQINRIDL